MGEETYQIRVLLIDDHETIHKEIGEALSINKDIKLIAQGRNGEEAIALCDKHLPDVILMDISMPIMNGLEATQIIVKRHPEAKIIAMTGIDDSKTILKMISAGAIGYILKDAHPQELASTVRAVFSGKSVFSKEIVNTMLHASPAVPKLSPNISLTRREMDILREMSLGLNNNEVAISLNISTATVRFHINNIVEKLGANNRTEAIVIATRDNLI